jgi:hypothetical protein
LPILPFDEFSIAANVIAVEAYIDSSIASVKRKTMSWWKNSQQFFPSADLHLACIGSDHVIRPEQSPCKARAKMVARSIAG